MNDLDTSEAAMEKALEKINPKKVERVVFNHESGAKIEVYQGRELLQEFQGDRWIIQGFLREGDLWLIKAKKKQGKSVLILQLAFCLSNGAKFLGSYEIKKQYKVLILASEMIMAEWTERVRNMKEMIGVNLDNITLMRCYRLALCNKEAASELLSTIKKMEIDYDIVIVDPIYKFFVGGNISDNVDATVFADNVDYIKDELDAAVIIVHHDSEKEGRNNKTGQKYEVATDENVYGSSLLAANITHSHTLKSTKSNGRYSHQLSLGVGRSGSEIDEVNLRMVIPQDGGGKLGFVLNDSCDSDTKNRIKLWLMENKEGTQKKICMETDVKDGTFRYAMYGNTDKDRKNSLIGNGTVEAFKKKGNANWYRLAGASSNIEIEKDDEDNNKISKVQREIGYG